MNINSNFGVGNENTKLLLPRFVVMQKKQPQQTICGRVITEKCISLSYNAARLIGATILTTVGVLESKSIEDLWPRMAKLMLGGAIVLGIVVVGWPARKYPVVVIKRCISSTTICDEE